VAPVVLAVVLLGQKRAGLQPQVRVMRVEMALLLVVFLALAAAVVLARSVVLGPRQPEAMEAQGPHHQLLGHQ
jgi:hypothetical protein